MSGARHDCAAVDAALDELYLALAEIHDSLPGRKRAPGADARSWGMFYLREAAADGDSFDLFRAYLERKIYQAINRIVGDPDLDGYQRQVRATLAAFDFVIAALGELPLIEICSTCGLSSTRRYCDECARELNLESYENPLHQEQTT